jgi:hypothetical protein
MPPQAFTLIPTHHCLQPIPPHCSGLSLLAFSKTQLLPSLLFHSDIPADHLLPPNFKYPSLSLSPPPFLLQFLPISLPPSPICSQPSWKSCPKVSTFSLATIFNILQNWPNSMTLFCPHFTVKFWTAVKKPNRTNKTEVQYRKKDVWFSSSRNLREQF